MPAIPRTYNAPDVSAVPTSQFLSGTHHLLRRLLSRADPSTPQMMEARALESRQNTIAIPTVYQGINSGPPAGEVVGIVLGSVAGFLLLIWLFSALQNGRGGGSVVEEEVIVRRDRGSRRTSRRSEMTSRSPRPERVIRQERIVRDTSRAPPRGGFVPPIERRVDGDDIVEVIEEGSSVAPRRKSKRSGNRSVSPESFTEARSHASFY